MSEVRKSNVKIQGRNGIIVHDKLVADGPVDPKTGEPLIDHKTGEPYPGKNDDMSALLHKYLEFIRGFSDVMTGSGYAPKFGVLSLLSQNTPIFCYDHPRFKKITNTAFTDGINVFIDADFMRKLVDQEIEHNETKSGVVFLILHELMHKLYNHVDRLKNYPPKIANIAEDLVINGKLVKGFKIKAVPMLNEIGVGMKEEEANKYYKMAEEVVAEMLLVQERKKKQEEQKDKKKKQDQSQSGGGSGQGDGDEQEQDQNENSDGSGQKKKKEKGDSENKENSKGGGEQENDSNEENDEEYSPIHSITPEELIEILEEEGLQDTVGKALNMPKNGDVEGLGKKKEQNEMQTIDAIETAMSQANSCPDGKYPGQHIAEHAAETIAGLRRGKVQWKIGLNKHILGDTMNLRHSDDEADIPWYLDKDSMGVDPWYMGSLLPQSPDETVLCLIDTSGSTSGGNMRQEFISEALALKKGVSTASDTAKEVILLSADTVIRGEPIMITEDNVSTLENSGVPIFGNGGTDFARCLTQALEMPVLKKKKIKTVIYFTDCCDAPPRREDFKKYLDKGIKIVFMTTPGMWNEQWNRDVSPFAEVYCIEENTKIDLNKNGPNEINTRKNRT